MANRINSSWPTLPLRQAAQRGGAILVHEHVFCRVRPHDLPIAASYLQSQLEQSANEGIRIIFDLTTYTLPDAFLPIVEGNPEIHIACCAGYYLKSKIPGAYRHLDSIQLAEKLEQKLTCGIGRAKRIPEIVKIASSGEVLTGLEKRIFKAAAMIQRKLNVPIATHACRGGKQQAELLLEQGADLKRIFFSHMEMELKGGRPKTFDNVWSGILWILERGGFIFLGDFTVANSDYRRQVVRLVKTAIAEGYEKQLLLSADSYWSVRSGRVSVRGSGVAARTQRDYTFTTKHIVPVLLDSGLTEQQTSDILIVNPRRLLNLPI